MHDIKNLVRHFLFTRQMMMRNAKTFLKSNVFHFAEEAIFQGTWSDMGNQVRSADLND